MLNDLIPIVLDAPSGEDIILKPIGDLHVGAPQFNEALWKEFKKSIGEKEKIIIVGDMIDNTTRGSVGNVYESRMSPSAQKEWLTKELEPFAENILCGVGGNHERRSKREVDDDPLYDVFCRLKIEERYRPSAAFVLLRIGGAEQEKPGKLRPTYTICVTHGAGGGMYIGSSANKSERFGMAIDNLDLLVTGHTHKPVTFPSAKLKIVPQNKKIIRQQFTAVTCTSWMDYGGYALEKMLTPTTFTLQEIILSGAGKKNKGIAMIYNQSHYADTTAAEAIYNVDIDKKTEKAISCIKKFLKKKRLCFK